MDDILMFQCLLDTDASLTDVPLTDRMATEFADSLKPCRVEQATANTLTKRKSMMMREIIGTLKRTAITAAF